MHAYRLSDGQQMWIRPIEPGDAWRIQEGLRLLSVTEVDQVNHLALVAVSVATGRLVAVARCVRLPDQPDTAEWAIVVADPLQGKGLGTHLVRALADEAMAQGIRRFTATMDGENRAVLRLLARVTDHFEASAISGGVRELVGVV